MPRDQAMRRRKHTKVVRDPAALFGVSGCFDAKHDRIKVWVRSPHRRPEVSVSLKFAAAAAAMLLDLHRTANTPCTGPFLEVFVPSNMKARLSRRGRL